MEIVYVLIPLSLVLVALVVGALLWAVRSGQFDDLEGPAWRVLLDDDDRPRGADAPRAGGDGGADPPAPGQGPRRDDG